MSRRPTAAQLNDTQKSHGRNRNDSRSRSPPAHRNMNRGRNRADSEESEENWKHDRYNNNNSNYGNGDEGYGNGGRGKNQHKKSKYQNASQKDPTLDVVLHGLLPTSTEESIYAQMIALNADIHNVRIIYDKASGRSRGFGFARFNHLESAKYWVDTYFPSVQIDGTRVTFDYSASKHHEDGAAPWICNQCGCDNRRMRIVCFRCGLPKPDSNMVNSTVNDGSQDYGDIPNTVLLLRGLDSLTEADKIFEQLKLLAPIQEIRLIKDRLTNVSWGFAFAVFNAVPHAASTLSQIWQAPYGFYLDGKQISVSYAHLNSFVAGVPGSQFSINVKDPATGVDTTVTYWDDKGYASVYPTYTAPAITTEISTSISTAVAAEIPQATFVSEPVIDEKKINVEDELEAFMSTFDETAVENESSAVENKVEEPVVSSAPDLKSLEQQELEMIQAQEKKKKAPKKVQMQLAKWQEKHDELVQPSQQESAEPTVVSDEELMKKLPSDTEINEQKQDLNLIACLLCERKFGDVNVLKKHQLKSDLHKTNLAKFKETRLSELRAEAQQEVKQYRNRAAERRQMHGQPRRPPSSSSSNYEPVIVREEPTKFGIGQDNIGNKMLKAMGWKDGEGLGKDGSGIVNPIEAQMVNKGVGLGASTYVPPPVSVYTDEKYAERAKRLMNLSKSQAPQL